MAIDTISLLLIAVLIAMVAFIQWRMRKDVSAVRVEAGTTLVTLAAVKEDVKELVIHTNSIKDALVASEKATSYLEGREEARIEGETKAAELARVGGKDAGGA